MKRLRAARIVALCAVVVAGCARRPERVISAESPPATPKRGSEATGMTHEEFETLDRIPPPGVSAQFKMDGELDAGAALIASNGGLRLYAICRIPELYVAVASDRLAATDTLLFIASEPGAMRAAPASRKNRVASWLDYLEHKASDRSTQWHDASEAILNGYSASATGTVVEGVVDIELLLGVDPGKMFLAAGEWNPATGALARRVPKGGAGPDLGASGFQELVCK